MKSWIEVFAGFQDAESDVQKLTHHGADDELSGLARECQAILEWLTPVGFVQGDHGRHGEGFAQEGMADLGQSGFGFHAATGFVLTAVEAGEGSQRGPDEAELAKRNPGSPR